MFFKVISRGQMAMIARNASYFCSRMVNSAVVSYFDALRYRIGAAKAAVQGHIRSSLTRRPGRIPRKAPWKMLCVRTWMKAFMSLACYVIKGRRNDDGVI